jgi:ribosomal protein S12 methylthiotransferase
MLGLLQQAGYRIVPEEEAEILIVNTCGFIQSAKEEAVETTLEAAQYKEHGNCRVLIMAGCFSQRYVNDLVQEMPEVDYFMGLDDVPQIVEICQQLEQNMLGTLESAGRVSRVSDTLVRANPSVYLYDAMMPRLNIGPKHTAYVKIAEGCRYQCSFCAIPMIRGKLRSRSMDSIVQEVSALGEQGVKEVILIAQDTTSYGVDLGGKPLIVPLLEHLVTIDNVRWIRLMYAYPTSLNLALMKLIAQEEKICTYLDLPLQHIDNAILKRMKRAMTEIKTRRLIEQLRTEMPGLTLRTSFIVGFPGENEEKFHKL